MGPSPAALDDELDAHGDHFDIVSLWRSERGLNHYATQALGIAEAVATALGEDAKGRATIAIAEHPKFLRDSDPALPKHTIYAPAFAVDGSKVPAISVIPRLHDRTHFYVGLPPVPRRLVALSAASAGLGQRLDQAGPDSGPRLHRWSGKAMLAAQAGLEAAGCAPPMVEDPWLSTGILELQTVLAEFDAGPTEGGDTPSARAKALAELAQAKDPDLDGPITLPPGKAFCATAGEVARMLMAQSGGDAEKAASNLAGLDPKWTVEAGAFGKHPFGWHTAAPRQHDALMLSAEPMTGDFVLRTEIFLISSDLKALPQADIVIGDRDGSRFLVACSHKEGIYLFQRQGHGGDYVALTDAKDNHVPIAKRIPVEVRVEGEVLSVTVGGVELQSLRIKDRTLDGRFGIGAHIGSTILFKPVEIERLGGK